VGATERRQAGFLRRFDVSLDVSRLIERTQKNDMSWWL
jgi:hypothetical protein